MPNGNILYINIKYYVHIQNTDSTDFFMQFKDSNVTILCKPCSVNPLPYYTNYQI